MEVSGADGDGGGGGGCCRNVGIGFGYTKIDEKISPHDPRSTSTPTTGFVYM